MPDVDLIVSWVASGRAYPCVRSALNLAEAGHTTPKGVPYSASENRNDQTMIGMPVLFVFNLSRRLFG